MDLFRGTGIEPSCHGAACRVCVRGSGCPLPGGVREDFTEEGTFESGLDVYIEVTKERKRARACPAAGRWQRETSQ